MQDPNMPETGAPVETPSTSHPVPDARPVPAVPAAAEPRAPRDAPPAGVWSDDQVEAIRTRLSEVTATVVDRAAGAVMETINTVAAAIRARSSSGRRR